MAPAHFAAGAAGSPAAEYRPPLIAVKLRGARHFDAAWHGSRTSGAHSNRSVTLDRVRLTIEGMTCEHCVRAVSKRLADTPGVEVEAVEIGSAVIRMDRDKTNIESVEDAIADEGYTAFVT